MNIATIHIYTKHIIAPLAARVKPIFKKATLIQGRGAKPAKNNTDPSQMQKKRKISKNTRPKISPLLTKHYSGPKMEAQNDRVSMPACLFSPDLAQKGKIKTEVAPTTSILSVP